MLNIFFYQFNGFKFFSYTMAYYESTTNAGLLNYNYIGHPDPINFYSISLSTNYCITAIPYTLFLYLNP